MNLLVSENYETLSKIAADKIVKAVNDKPDTVLGLATGSTPIGLYQQLILYYKNKCADFSKTVTFNLDEYIGISADHPQSYHYYMKQYLFDHINIDKANIHIPNGMSEDIEYECKTYDEAICAYGGIDLQILGIGSNGHVGFNEPNDTLIARTHVARLNPKTIQANARFFNSQEEVPKQAITIGMGHIMKAKEIILLASGKNKADSIRKLIMGKIDTCMPASLLQMHPKITVIADYEAAELL